MFPIRFASFLAALFLLLAAPRAGSAQTDSGYGYVITCSTQDTVDAFLPPANSVAAGSAARGANFVLRFSGNVPQRARAGMEFAADVWASYLESDVDILVDVDWRDRGDRRLLASAGPGTLIRDFPGGVRGVWYPVSLAESLAGENFNGDRADITVTANSTANWYFGTDGRTPRGRIDLVSVFLHELGHGLGFLSSADTISATELGIGFDNRFIVFDLGIETRGGDELTDRALFRNPSPELLEAALSNELVFDGLNANGANGNRRVPLFAPGSFDAGSSVSHLDERTYRPGNENALMTPFLASGEAAHDPGPVTLGLFQDLGWSVNFDLLPVRERLVDAELPVFPNPSDGAVTLHNPFPTAARSTLSVVDAAGRRVLHRELPRNATSPVVSLTGLVPGMYQLLVSDGAAVRTGRVVVR